MEKLKIFTSLREAKEVAQKMRATGWPAAHVAPLDPLEKNKRYIIYVHRRNSRHGWCEILCDDGYVRRCR